MSGLDRLTQDYRAAFLRYLPRRDEVALARGYEIGRSAVGQGVSVLDLAQIHHAVLLEVLGSSRPEDIAAVASAASEFFVEVLATVDMTQRAFPPTE
jgi:hypothetical protein